MVEEIGEQRTKADGADRERCAIEIWSDAIHGSELGANENIKEHSQSAWGGDKSRQEQGCKQNAPIGEDVG